MFSKNLKNLFVKLVVDRRKILKSQLGKDIFFNTILLTLSKSIGFLVPIIIANTFGINWETDVFFYIYSLLMFFTMGIAATIEAVLVPFLVGKNSEERNSLVSQLSLWSLIILSGFAVLVIYLLEPSVSLITNFSPNQLSLLKNLSYALLPVLFLIVLNSISNSLLSVGGLFKVISISTTVRAVSIVICLILFVPEYGVFAMPYSYLAGEFLKLLFGVIVISQKLGFEFYYKLKPEKQFLEFGKTGVYQFFSVTIIALSPFIDRAMAALLKEGSLTTIEYAEKIYLIPVTIITIGTSLIILPRWARIFESSDFLKLNSEIRNISIILFAAGIVFVSPIILFSKEIVSTFFGGKLNQSEILNININSIIYLIGVPFYVVSVILIRAVLATKNTQILMKISLFRLALKILVNVILIAVIGIYGIPSSSSINAMILMFTLLFILKRKLHNRDGVELVHY